MKIRILHLSDLHFGTIEDANLWHSQLTDGLKLELQCKRLDGLIISGDVANFSVSSVLDGFRHASPTDS